MQSPPPPHSATSSAVRNAFVGELLSLQQDGRGAISTPAQWLDSAPLLYVETEIDAEISRLAPRVIQGATNRQGTWHFFVGSPGNGKSAAMGRLCRALVETHRCDLRDRDGTELRALPAHSLPYELEVFEASKPFPSARLVQDASVVPNPFAPDVDPSRQLLITLEDAWSRGMSLVVCANRGVLEGLVREVSADVLKSREPWFLALTQLLSRRAAADRPPSARPTTRNRVFDEIQLFATSLDSRSLLIGADTLDHIVQKAVSNAHWGDCAPCPARAACPFLLNQRALADPGGRASLLRLLQRAEVCSGQVVVLREALALISLLLAGCARDYGTVHPCDWVRESEHRGDVFALATRRIYMVLFASAAPHGLDPDPVVRAQQIQGLKPIAEYAGTRDTVARHALDPVLHGRAPSTDVGLCRLLSSGGVLDQIAVWCEPIEIGFAERWDADYAQSLPTSPLISDLEARCLRQWRVLEDGIASRADHNSIEANWALRRWSSMFLLSLGAFVEGATAWAAELDTCIEFVRALRKIPVHRSADESWHISRLDELLRRLLDSALDGSAGTVRLADNVQLTGPWVQAHLRPKATSSEASGAVAIAVMFDEERVTLPAVLLIWLLRRSKSGLHSRCVPELLLSGIRDAKIRAAAQSEYSTAPSEDVELHIGGPEGLHFALTRVSGNVHVRHA